MLPTKARYLLGLIVPLTFVFFLEGCSSRVQKPAPIVKPSIPKKPKPSQTVTSRKVALLVPLSGPSRGLGKSLQNAAELAFFENGHDGMELIIEDTLGTPEGTALATQKALDKGSELILGPLFSKGTPEVVKLANPRQVPVLSFTNDKTAAAPQTFVLGFDPQEQIQRVLSYTSKKGKKSLIAFIPNDDYGTLAESALRRQEQQGTIKIVHLEKYDARNPSSLSRKSFPKTDLLFIAEGGQNLSRLLSTLLYHENKLESYQLIGTGQWDTPSIRSNHSLTGAWFASPDSQPRLKFEEMFQETYGYRPPRLSTLAYDAVSLVAALSKSFPANPFAKDTLTRSVGFSGIDGLFRLKSDGTVQRGLAILEVHPEAFRILEKMPRNF